jgi:hypothetical protein
LQPLPDVRLSLLALGILGIGNHLWVSNSLSEPSALSLGQPAAEGRKAE